MLRSFLPTPEGLNRSRNVKKDQHQERNSEQQDDQAKFYNANASHDRELLRSGDSVDVYSTLNKQWEPAEFVRLYQSQEQPHTYIIKKENKQNQQRRQCIKQRRGHNSTIENTRTSIYPVVPPARFNKGSIIAIGSISNIPFIAVYRSQAVSFQ